MDKPFEYPATWEEFRDRATLTMEDLQKYSTIRRGGGESWHDRAFARLDSFLAKVLAYGVFLNGLKPRVVLAKSMGQVGDFPCGLRLVTLHNVNQVLLKIYDNGFRDQHITFIGSGFNDDPGFALYGVETSLRKAESLVTDLVKAWKAADRPEFSS